MVSVRRRACRHLRSSSWQGACIVLRMKLSSILLVFMCSVAASYSLTGLDNPPLFSIPDRGAVSYDTSGMASALTVGYAQFQADAGSSMPAGYLVLSFRNHGVLV